MASIDVAKETAVDAADIREVLETILPEGALRATVQVAGLQSRQRKLDG